MDEATIKNVWAVLGIGGLMALGWWLDQFGKLRPGIFHRRGAKLLSFEEATRKAAHRPRGIFVAPAGFKGLLFGGIRLPIDYAYVGLGLLGEIGAGKTTLLMQYLESVLELVACRCGCRLLLFDPKREFTGHVLGRLPRHTPVFIANSFDVRSAKWRCADDIVSYGDACQLSYALIEEDRAETQKFFRDAARSVLKAVILGLNARAPGRWDMRDVLLICRSRRRLIWFLRLTHVTRDYADLYLRARSGRDVVATLGAFLDRYSAAVACTQTASASFSLREFLDSAGVLILALDDAFAEALKPIYSLFISLLKDQILLRNNPRSTTFTILDELPALGKCNLIPLAIKGRSAGSSLFVACQDVQALEAVHGEKEAKALLGCLLSKGFLRVTSDGTAKFVADAIGKEEVDQFTINVSNGGQTRTHTIVQRQLVMEDELKSLPLPDYAAGVVSGYFKLPGVGTYRADVRFRDGAPPPLAGPAVPDYLRRPAADEVLLPFSMEDVRRLRLPSEAKALAALGVPPLRAPNPPQLNRVS